MKLFFFQLLLHNFTWMHLYLIFDPSEKWSNFHINWVIVKLKLHYCFFLSAKLDQTFFTIQKVELDFFKVSSKLTLWQPSILPKKNYMTLFIMLPERTVKFPSYHLEFTGSPLSPPAEVKESCRTLCRRTFQITVIFSQWAISQSYSLHWCNSN